jgi:hypothetical protein
MASNGDYLGIPRAAIRTQIVRSFATAKFGILNQTTGTTKLAARRLRVRSESGQDGRA